MKRALIWLGLGVAAVIAVLTVQFRQDMKAARDRLSSIGAELAETPCGPVEYGQTGSGPPVISVHGIFGGFDQGLLTAQGNIPAGYTIVAPSRFGYLGTPMPFDPTPEMQADAFVCVMDRLGTEKAAFLGTSAGATSVLLVALRHPDRVAGIVLISPNAPGEVEVTLMPRALTNVLFRSNFLFWAMGEYAGGSLQSIMGVPAGFDLTPQMETDVAQVMTAILPVKPRADGALFDMYVSNPAINAGLRFEDISVPVLIVSAQDDPLALYENAEALAARIPAAQFLSLPNGGHMLLGHQQEVRAAIGTFLGAVFAP